jgi:thiamine pyrophosphokinase
MKFTPMGIFSGECKSKAVIFLNNQKSIPHPMFGLLWKNSYPIAFVDGFANQIYAESTRDNYTPQLLTGDFDSISTAALKYYKSKSSVTVIETPDQDETDFTKCLRIVSDFIEKKKIDSEVIVGAHVSGGRLDHEFGLIQSLFEARNITSVPVVLVSDFCVTLLLDAGEHTVNVNTGLEGEHCGLIPIGRPCTVTSKGLKWNLNNQVLSFGSLVSTSNMLVDPVVSIHCDSPLLLTIEYKETLKTVV